MKRILVFVLGVVVAVGVSASPALAAHKSNTAKLAKLVKRQGKQLKALKKELNAVKKSVKTQGVGTKGGTGVQGNPGEAGPQGENGSNAQIGWTSLLPYTVTSWADYGQKDQMGNYKTAQKLVKTGNDGVLPVGALGINVVDGQQSPASTGALSLCPANSWAIGASVNAASGTASYTTRYSYKIPASANTNGKEGWQVFTDSGQVKVTAICLQYSTTG